MLMKKMILAPSDSGSVRFLKRSYSRIDRIGCKDCDFYEECINPYNKFESVQDSKFWFKCRKITAALLIKTRADRYRDIGIFCNYEEIINKL